MNDIDTLVPEPHTPTPWRRVHRATAIGVGGFAVVHLAHHLCALGGLEVHLAAAAVLRRVYRHPWLEPVLLLAVAMQWFTGAILVARRLRRQGTRLPCGVWLRWSAGLVMSVFLPVHVLSVLS